MLYDLSGICERNDLIFFKNSGSIQNTQRGQNMFEKTFL